MLDLGSLGMALLNAAQDDRGLESGILTSLLSNQNLLSGLRKQQNTPSMPLPNIPTPLKLPAESAITESPAIKSLKGMGLLTGLKDAALQAYPDNPMMQKVALTQAILESGLQDGTPSALARKNNFFGIKAPGTAGTVNMGTTEVYNGVPVKTSAAFGANLSPSDSFLQYRTLINKPRYTPVLSSKNPYEAFGALQRSGYATDPQYAQKLTRLYDKYVTPLYS